MPIYWVAGSSVAFGGAVVVLDESHDGVVVVLATSQGVRPVVEDFLAYLGFGAVDCCLGLGEIGELEY